MERPTKYEEVSEADIGVKLHIKTPDKAAVVYHSETWKDFSMTPYSWREDKQTFRVTGDTVFFKTLDEAISAAHSWAGEKPGDA